MAGFLEAPDYNLELQTVVAQKLFPYIFSKYSGKFWIARYPTRRMSNVLSPFTMALICSILFYVTSALQIWAPLQ